MQSVILGTAQWGLDYGATNAAGRLSDPAITSVVAAAVRAGIRTLDTAPGYGDAEVRIGSLAPAFAIQTKASVAEAGLGAVRASVEASLSRLRRDSLDAVLVHDWSAADQAHRMAAARELEVLRSEGLIGAVGVSPYDEGDLVAALECFSLLDVVQVAVSVLDQRLVGSPALAEVRARGGRVQARSVFLQGVALAPADHRLFGNHPDVARLRVLGNPLGLCLAYVLTLDWVDELVVAVTTEEELAQILGALEEPIPDVRWDLLASADEWLVDPRRWTAPTQGG